MNKVSASEKQVLDAIKFGDPLPYRRGTSQRLKRHEKAIKTLKEKGLIEKGKDNILRLVKPAPTVDRSADETNGGANGFTATERMLISKAVWAYINEDPNLQPTWAIGAEIVRKIKLMEA